MVTGIESFKEWFKGSEEQYAVIGGTACDILMTEEGLDFRATKDIDLVLIIDGVTVLDAAYLIPFKEKAWMDLTDRKAAGEHVDSKKIKKHKNDVFRLTELIDPTSKVMAPQGVYEDIRNFVQRMQTDRVDIKQLGLADRTKEQILEEVKEMYIVQ